MQKDFGIFWPKCKKYVKAFAKGVIKRQSNDLAIEMGYA
jgi:hypothetical protein